MPYLSKISLYIIRKLVKLKKSKANTVTNMCRLKELTLKPLHIHHQFDV